MVIVKKNLLGKIWAVVSIYKIPLFFSSLFILYQQYLKSIIFFPTHSLTHFSLHKENNQYLHWASQLCDIERAGLSLSVLKYDFC